MNVFLQGMRRSGTTIFFDLFCEDGRLVCWYEPLAAALKPAVGGGSGARQVDYFENVRALRNRILAGRPDLPGPEAFNLGGPHDVWLELGDEMPEHVRQYLREICVAAPRTLIKFTRAYRKVPALHDVDPDAAFVHIVRDPRLVTASYLFGKHRRNHDRFPDADTFFGRTSTGTAWSSYPLSEGLLAMPEYARFRGLPDFMRILLIWKDCFESTRRDGLACFGDRYMLVRHEDLLCDPVPTLERLYGHIGLDVPERVRSWASATVHKQPSYYEAGHPEWLRACERLDLMPALVAAGYVPTSVTPGT